ncbi:outer membrane protein [Hasllibacter halocynthiae]|uniref:Outer membrane protein n=1 Tax=Hasllibacter halocynthiae TaxID=595589 RepID=A0A2T0X6Y8_9RHOB|nr:MipA/OmpV family protein [Hasllibacter halocynthiae]PRY94687.1 outer membrane protein [Hasllibacter halocynthiae]
MRPTIAALSTAALLLAGPSLAQSNELAFSLRGGVAAAPAYPGADEYEVGPDLGFSFGSLEWAGRSFGGVDRTGPALRGSFRYLGERDDEDYPELAGLEDVDPALELGLGVIYRQPSWQAFADVRRGFGGHEGTVGELGADLILRPGAKTTVTAGPRLSFGDGAYAGTYFGVAEAEADASAFEAFDAEGGLLGAGFEVVHTYRLNDDWAVESGIGYERLMNDAADSPITRDEDQFSVRVGISRAIRLNF